MQISELAAVSSRLEIDYPVVSDTEKGFWVKAAISACINGRNFQFSALGDGKTLPTATKKALESVLVLFDGIAFDSMPSQPQPIVETSALETQPQPLKKTPVTASEPESVAQTSEPQSQLQPIEETPVILSESEPVAQTLEAESQPQPLEEIPVIASEPEPVVQTSEPESQPQTIEETPTVDFMAESTKEITRLGWTAAQGKQYLLDKYNVVSRLLLSPEQLEEFYVYLKTISSPEATPETTPEAQTLPVLPPTVAEVPTSQAQSGASGFDPSQLVKFDLNSQVNFQQVITASNCAIKILGLTSEEAKAECMKLYGKRSRQLLSDSELIDYSNNLVDRASAKMTTATAA